MTHIVPDGISTLISFFQATVPPLVVFGLWFALKKTSFERARRLRIWATISAIFVTWYGLAFWLGHAGIFIVTADQIPRIQFAILLPIALGLIMMLTSFQGRAVVAATPLSWLTAIQVYRALGGIFLILWYQGKLPGEFAIPAGIGDIIVGVTAPFVAWLNARGAASAASVTRAWNIFGILDLVVAVGTGFLTSPSPIQLLALDRPNELITAYPLVMVPAFLVPLSIILHGISLWKLSAAQTGSGDNRRT